MCRHVIDFAPSQYLGSILFTSLSSWFSFATVVVWHPVFAYVSLCIFLGIFCPPPTSTPHLPFNRSLSQTHLFFVTDNLWRNFHSLVNLPSYLPSSILPLCSLLVSLWSHILVGGSFASTKLFPEVSFFSFCNFLEQLRRGGHGRHYTYTKRLDNARTYKAEQCGQAGQAAVVINLKFGPHGT